jgi:hypothetical protein
VSSIPELRDDAGSAEFAAAELEEKELAGSATVSCLEPAAIRVM